MSAAASARPSRRQIVGLSSAYRRFDGRRYVGKRWTRCVGFVGSQKKDSLERKQEREKIANKECEGAGKARAITAVMAGEDEGCKWGGGMRAQQMMNGASPDLIPAEEERAPAASSERLRSGIPSK